MRKRESFWGWDRRFATLVLALFVFVVLKSNVGLAYEREIIFSEEYQTAKEKEMYRYEKEKVSFRDRFHLVFSWGYGYSYAQIVTGIYGPSPELRTYLEPLDMEFSENLLALRLTATYVINPKMGIYFGVPFGFVKTKKEKEPLARLFEDDKLEAGVGDVYGGIYYNLLSEAKIRPNIVVNFDVNSNLAKHYSLGDGLWDFTLGIQPRKFMTKSFYLFGVGDYTFRLEENNIEPGGIVGYGGGVGFLLGNTIIEPGLKAYNIGKTEFESETLFEDDEDLVFSLALKSLYKGLSGNLTIGNLDKGLDVKTTTVGFEFSYPIL